MDSISLWSLEVSFPIGLSPQPPCTLFSKSHGLDFNISNVNILHGFFDHVGIRAIGSFSYLNCEYAHGDLQNQITSKQVKYEDEATKLSYLVSFSVLS